MTLWQHPGQRLAVARRIVLAVSSPRDPERRAVAGLRAGAHLRAADGVYRLWDYRAEAQPNWQEKTTR
jgi:hypothetical protein